MNRGIPKSKQRRLQAQKAANERWKHKENLEKPPKADPTMMVISCYENGTTYTKAKGVLAAQGVDSPSKSTFYRHQKIVNKTIVDLAKESMAEEREKMVNGTCLSCDGAFAHRRNSSQCHGAFINCHTGQIVAGSVITKDRKKGDFSGPSNMMESEMIRRNIAQIDKSKVSKYVHDRDNKTGGIMSQNIPDITEKIDPNHGKKWFATYWDKLVSGAYRTMRTLLETGASAVMSITQVQYRNKFRGLKTHVQEWFNTLLYEKNDDSQQKKEKWLNTQMHVLGNHDHCTHGDKKCFVWKKGLQDEELQKDFKDFLNDSKIVYDRVDPKLNTNSNESLHAVTARLADKNTPWSKDGYEGRVHYSYLRHNKPFECPYLIRKRCNKQINPIDRKNIETTIDERRKLQETRRSEIYQRKESIRRNKFKKEMKSSPGDYIGVPYTKICK